jgi:Flp pilus assembly protein TadD
MVHPKGQGPKSLSLDEGASGALVLALVSLPGEWGPETRSMARRFASLPGVSCMGRISEKRMAVLMRSNVKEASDNLKRARSLCLSQGLRGKGVAVGYAVFPDDADKACLGRLPDAKDLLMEKAATALFFAEARNSPSPVAAFKDLVRDGGEITQVLPQDRVIVSLGLGAGALPGQIFIVKDDSGKVKGEASLFESHRGYSLAHAMVADPLRPFRAGDRLEYSGRDEGIGERSLSYGTETLNHKEKLQNLLTSLSQGDKPFVFALARLDDYEKRAALTGEDEAEKNLSQFLNALREKFIFPPASSLSYEPGCASLIWLSPPEALEIKLKEFLSQPDSQKGVSMGLVFHPTEVLPPENILEGAEAALLESAMTGPQSVVSFGPQTLNILGDRLFDEGDTAGAILEYRKGLLLDPGHLNLLNSLGVCYGRQGDQKAAMTAFEDVLRLDPDNLMATFNKGCSFILSGQPEEAEKALEKAARLDPENFEILFQLGKTALELGHLDKALNALHLASEQKGKRGAVHRLLGRARLLKGDPLGAMSAFKKAVKFNPDDAQSLSSLGVLFREHGHDDVMALSLFRRSVELDPSNSLFRRRLGALYYDLGRFQDAEHHLKSALEYSGKNHVSKELESLDALAAELNKAAESGN